MSEAEMPKYKCHKEVHALKILSVEKDSDKAAAEGRETDGSGVLVVEHPYAPIRVNYDFMRKHRPEAGGYYVVYADGYKSYSPAGPFEDGYTRIP